MVEEEGWMVVEGRGMERLRDEGRERERQGGGREGGGARQVKRRLNGVYTDDYGTSLKTKTHTKTKV